LSYLYVNRFVIAQKLTELEDKTITSWGRAVPSSGKALLASI
jgi:hypothetical protein